MIKEKREPDQDGVFVTLFLEGLQVQEIARSPVRACTTYLVSAFAPAGLAIGSVTRC